MGEMVGRNRMTPEIPSTWTPSLSIGWPGLTLPLALPYWLEGGMVAVQIVVWKASGGRRQLFGTAPLHRWLEKRGFDPVNIFYIFGVLALLGLALTLQAARAS